MKCVFAIKSLAVQGGGAERVLVDVANGLVARGHDISVVTFDQPQASTFYALDPRVARTGVAIGRPGVPTPRLQFLAGLSRLRRAVVAGRPDVVAGFMHSTYVPLALATLGAGLRLVASEHAALSHFRGRWMQRLLVRASDFRFIRKTVPSACLRDEYPKAERRKIYVLPNPVDIDQFANARVGFDDRSPTLLCVGGFRKEKGHAVLLKAFARVAEEFPEWNLLLVGDGVLRRELEALIAQLGLCARVEMPGFSTKVAEEYARAEAVVVPSRHEAFGLVVVEALASSRPVIGFADALGPLEIAVDGQNAVLVDGTGDRVEHLATGLRRLMADAALRRRFGEAGPASVQRFARDEVVDQWETFLLRCAGDA